MKAVSLHQKIVRDFPHLTPDSAALTRYSGFLHSPRGTYRVSVSSSGRVHGDAAVRAVLSTAPPAALRRIAAAPDTHALLVELRDAVERAEDRAGGQDSGAGDAKLPPAAFYEGLLRELSAVGWENVCGMDEAMQRVQLRVRDEAGREHVLSLVLPGDYPLTAPAVSAALPEQFKISSWARGTSSLSTALAEFRGAVSKYQPLFNALDDIDDNCWVLEPERPLRSEVYRRIAIGKHSSLRVELDPRAPMRAVPECRFLGSEAAVGPLRTKLNENMRAWVTAGAVLPRANLETVLDLALPPPPKLADGASQDLGLECGICYAYRLNDRVPEVACDRSECARPYHRPCLVEWLKALPDTRQSFETLFGTCPYCELHISVSVTEA